MQVVNIKDLELRTDDWKYDLVLLMKEAIDESPYGGTSYTDLDDCEYYVNRFLEDDTDDSNIFVLLDETRTPCGFLIAHIVDSPHLVFVGKRVAIELAWYVDPSYRGGMNALKLVNAYEEWSKNRGADVICLSNFNNETGSRLHHVYEKRGYLLTEKSYMKGL